MHLTPVSDDTIRDSIPYLQSKDFSRQQHDDDQPERRLCRTRSANIRRMRGFFVSVYVRGRGVREEPHLLQVADMNQYRRISSVIVISFFGKRQLFTRHPEKTKPRISRLDSR